MNDLPEVSVVMSVYNGAEHLAATLDSVLSQQGCDFEFIVIDDGSTDGCAQLLDDYAARDPRLRVVHQQNTGLTRALIRGCDLAKAEFIARQDAGDISLPGRLAAQLAFSRQNPQSVMVCCAVQVVGPLGEPLFTTSRPMFVLDAGLRNMDNAHLRGPPHHGATMFLRSAYSQAGGYRAAFAVAQDLDLWLRIAELGQCLGLDQTFYQANLACGSISNRRRGEQMRMTDFALKCKRVRLDGGDDQSLLDQCNLAAIAPGRMLTNHERARFHYFVGSCLRAHNPVAAKGYFRQTLRDNPLHLKALVRWVLG